MGIALGQLPGQVTDSLTRGGDCPGEQRVEPGWVLESGHEKKMGPEHLQPGRRMLATTYSSSRRTQKACGMRTAMLPIQ